MAQHPAASQPHPASAVQHIDATARNTPSDTAAIAASLLDADLWPVDSELVTDIRTMFLENWGMHSGQADARMSHFNYAEAVAAMPRPAPGAIGSAFGGGMYAGISRGVDGAPDEYLVLLDGDADGMDWEAAGAWANSKGGRLPTRAEQRLLMANLPDQFKPTWYWSNEPAGPSLAWIQYFGDGYQSYYYRSSEGSVRAVRRLSI